MGGGGRVMEIGMGSCDGLGWVTGIRTKSYGGCGDGRTSGDGGGGNGGARV